MAKENVSYQPGDRIFAKVKGHPHWPARINLLPEDVTVPKGKYPIFFYGTYEVYFLTPKDIFPYEKWKHKYALPKPRPVFQKGLEEIEKNPDVLLYNKDPNAVKFLSQFYQFKKLSSSKTQQCPSSVETLERRSLSPVNLKSPVSPFSPPTLLPAIEMKTEGETPRQSKKRRLSTVSKSEPPTKRKAKTVQTPTNLERTPNLETEQEAKSLKPKNRPSNASEKPIECKKDEEETQKPAPATIVQPVKIRHKMLHPSSPVKIPIQQESANGSKATTALGRPMRKSASQFSARRLLKSSAFRDVLYKDEDSNEDTDWKPKPNSGSLSSSSLSSDDHLPKSTSLTSVMLTHHDQQSKKSLATHLSSITPMENETKPNKSLVKQIDLKLFGDDSDSSTSSSFAYRRHKCLDERRVHPKKHHHSSSVSSSQSRACQHNSSAITILKSSSQRHNRETDDSCSPTVSSTTSCVPLIKPQKPSNVSLSPEELNKMAKRPNQNSCQKQLKELGTEAKLLRLHRGIKTSLILGQENIPVCLKRLELLEEMEITLPVLVKCGTVIVTIRKCCRYTRSLDVKIAARKVFNRFLKLLDNATQEELDLAHAELMENNRRMDNDSSDASRPQTVADLFKPPPIAQPVVNLSPQPPESEPILKSSPPEPLQISLPIASSPTPVSLSEVTSTTTNLPPPPPLPPQPPLPDNLPLKEEDIFEQTCLPVSAKSPTSGSESEGLAPSLGGQDAGEESDDSDDTPLFQLHPPQSLNGKQQQQTNVEATLAAVKQAFLLHSQIKQKQLQQQQQSVMPPVVVPPIISQQQPDTSRAYVPQPLHPCTVPPPSYVPCLSAGAPVLSPALALPHPQQFSAAILLPPIPTAFAQYRPNPTNFYHPTPDLSRPPPPPMVSPQPLPVIATTPPMVPKMRCSDSGGSHDEVIRPQRPRERARSPHALPHPLEHYQKCLSSALGSEQTTVSVAASVSDDLDTRIAKLLEAAGPRPPLIISPPPPPPPLPPSQNLLLSHRPGAGDGFRPHAPPPQFGNQPRPQLPTHPMPNSISYTPASPVQQDSVPGDFDPLQKNFIRLPPNPNQQQRTHGTKDAKAPDDVYSLLGI